MKQLSLIFVVLLLIAVSAQAQYGNRSNRGMNQLHGNEIRSRFYNYGLIGNIGELSFEWPAGTGNEYVGDFSPMLGVEFVHPSGDTLRSVINPDGPRGNSDGPVGGGSFWGFEPLPGFTANPPISNHSVAMSDEPETWPSSWPGKSADWSGHWIGPEQPGIGWAAQEAYFQMDDNSDREWRERNGQTLYPFPDDTSRGGVGLRVEVRYMQFDQAAYENALVMMYILHNDGVVLIDRARFGFVIGTFSGGRQDSQDDLCALWPEWNMVVSYDHDDYGSPGWVPVVPGVVNVGRVGVMFLKTPLDSGLTSFAEFSPPSAVRMKDDAALWMRLAPGHFDGPSGQPQDADLMIGTGDFPLLPGATDTVIAAVLFAADSAALVERASALQILCDQGFHLGNSPHFDIAAQEFSLSSIYPNPFNSAARISFTLPVTSHVSLRLYDIMGREVAMLMDEIQTAGEHHVSFDGSNLSSGVYLCRMQAGGFEQTKKIVLIR